MGDYVSLLLGMRLKADAPANLPEMVREILSPQRGEAGDGTFLASLTSRILITAPDVPDEVAEVAVIDGRLFIDAFTVNTNRVRDNGRSELALFLDLLDLYGDEPLGTVVGTLHGDWSYNDAGPLIVTGSGVAILDAEHDSLRNDSFGLKPARVSLSAISPEVAARLKRDDVSGWADYTKQDIDDVLAWAAAAPGP
ncbi:hypothetical protein [Sphingomonas sp. 3-13AW]|uniref:hypothetical protein n=1 Tax=Sphingomonas sp. 3-13AW TaxID=3050450 RepID=UPI003BB7E27D